MESGKVSTERRFKHLLYSKCFQCVSISVHFSSECRAPKGFISCAGQRPFFAAGVPVAEPDPLLRSCISSYRWATRVPLAKSQCRHFTCRPLCSTSVGAGRGAQQQHTQTLVLCSALCRTHGPATSQWLRCAAKCALPMRDRGDGAATLSCWGSPRSQTALGTLCAHLKLSNNIFANIHVRGCSLCYFRF